MVDSIRKKYIILDDDNFYAVYPQLKDDPAFQEMLTSINQGTQVITDKDKDQSILYSAQQILDETEIRKLMDLAAPNSPPVLNPLFTYSLVHVEQELLTPYVLGVVSKQLLPDVEEPTGNLFEDMVTELRAIKTQIQEIQQSLNEDGNFIVDGHNRGQYYQEKHGLFIITVENTRLDGLLVTVNFNNDNANPLVKALFAEYAKRWPSTPSPTSEQLFLCFCGMLQNFWGTKTIGNQNTISVTEKQTIDEWIYRIDANISYLCSIREQEFLYFNYGPKVASPTIVHWGSASQETIDDILVNDMFFFMCQDIYPGEEARNQHRDLLSSLLDKWKQYGIWFNFSANNKSKTLFYWEIVFEQVLNENGYRIYHLYNTENDNVHFLAKNQDATRYQGLSGHTTTLGFDTIVSRYPLDDQSTLFLSKPDDWPIYLYLTGFDPQMLHGLDGDDTLGPALDRAFGKKKEMDHEAWSQFMRDLSITFSLAETPEAVVTEYGFTEALLDAIEKNPRPDQIVLYLLGVAQQFRTPSHNTEAMITLVEGLSEFFINWQSSKFVVSDSGYVTEKIWLARQDMPTSDFFTPNFFQKLNTFFVGTKEEQKTQDDCIDKIRSACHQGLQDSPLWQTPERYYRRYQSIRSSSNLPAPPFHYETTETKGIKIKWVQRAAKRTGLDGSKLLAQDLNGDGLISLEELITANRDFHMDLLLDDIQQHHPLAIKRLVKNYLGQRNSADKLPASFLSTKSLPQINSLHSNQNRLPNDSLEIAFENHPFGVGALALNDPDLYGLEPVQRLIVSAHPCFSQFSETTDSLETKLNHLLITRKLTPRVFIKACKLIDTYREITEPAVIASTLMTFGFSIQTSSLNLNNKEDIQKGLSLLEPPEKDLLIFFSCGQFAPITQTDIVPALTLICQDDAVERKFWDMHFHSEAPAQEPIWLDDFLRITGYQRDHLFDLMRDLPVPWVDAAMKRNFLNFTAHTGRKPSPLSFLKYSQIRSKPGQKEALQYGIWLMQNRHEYHIAPEDIFGALLLKTADTASIHHTDLKEWKKECEIYDSLANTLESTGGNFTQTVQNAIPTLSPKESFTFAVCLYASDPKHYKDEIILLGNKIQASIKMQNLHINKARDLLFLSGIVGEEKTREFFAYLDLPLDQNPVIKDFVAPLFFDHDRLNHNIQALDTSFTHGITAGSDFPLFFENHKQLLHSFENTMDFFDVFINHPDVSENEREEKMGQLITLLNQHIDTTQSPYLKMRLLFWRAHIDPQADTSEHARLWTLFEAQDSSLPSLDRLCYKKLNPYSHYNPNTPTLGRTLQRTLQHPTILPQSQADVLMAELKQREAPGNHNEEVMAVYAENNVSIAPSLDYQGNLLNVLCQTLEDHDGISPKVISFQFGSFASGNQILSKAQFKALMRSDQAKYIRQRLKELDKKGITLIASAGNDFSNQSPSYINALNLFSLFSPPVCLVAAAQQNYYGQAEQPALYSSRGSLKKKPTVMGLYPRLEGTSFTAPQVASIVAKMNHIPNTMTGKQKIAILMLASDPLPDIARSSQGTGLVIEQRALWLMHAFNGDKNQDLDALANELHVSHDLDLLKALFKKYAPMIVRNPDRFWQLSLYGKGISL